jgi:hypothetical protein
VFEKFADVFLDFIAEPLQNLFPSRVFGYLGGLTVEVAKLFLGLDGLLEGLLQSVFLGHGILLSPMSGRDGELQHAFFKYCRKN